MRKLLSCLRNSQQSNRCHPERTGPQAIFSLGVVSRRICSCLSNNCAGITLRAFALSICLSASHAAAAQQPPSAPIVLHAARLLQVDTGTILRPGEILIQGDRIRAVGTSVDHPQGAKIVDLGDTTLSERKKSVPAMPPFPLTG